MKIAIIADSLDNQNAGVYNYTRSLVDALAKNKNREHEYILIRQKKEEGLPFRQIILKNISLPIGYTSFRLFFIIPFLLRKEKVDAVFEPAHFGPFNLPKKIKRITMIHDLTPILFPEYHRWHSQILQKIFLPRILQRADLIITNSNHTRKDLLKYQKINPTKIKTILLGKDEFYFPDENKMALENQNIKNDYVLNVGTIEPRKNLITLLKAFELFKQKNRSDIQLIIIGGDGWNNKDFWNAYDKHSFKKDIKILGYLKKEELRQFYTHALCMIYPSEYEGFGLPVLEALSCGCPVITTDNSSMPEVAGDAAFYFSPENHGQLLEHMVRIATQEHKMNSQELIQQSNQFSWAKYVDIFEELMEELS